MRPSGLAKEKRPQTGAPPNSGASSRARARTHKSNNVRRRRRRRPISGRRRARERSYARARARQVRLDGRAHSCARGARPLAARQSAKAPPGDTHARTQRLRPAQRQRRHTHSERLRAHKRGRKCAPEPPLPLFVRSLPLLRGSGRAPLVAGGTPSGAQSASERKRSATTATTKCLSARALFSSAGARRSCGCLRRRIAIDRRGVSQRIWTVASETAARAARGGQSERRWRRRRRLTCAAHLCTGAAVISGAKRRKNWPAPLCVCAHTHTWLHLRRWRLADVLVGVCVFVCRRARARAHEQSEFIGAEKGLYCVSGAQNRPPPLPPPPESCARHPRNRAPDAR